MRIDKLFDIEYPKTLAYSWLTPDENGINFVSSQDKDNGVVGKVQKEDGIKIYPAGCITVPLKGSVLMAHLQSEQCYVAHQIAVLIPKTKMSTEERLFYVACIRHNAYKYNYGRQADRTLGLLDVPLAQDNIQGLKFAPLSTKNKASSSTLDTKNWKIFQIKDIFNVVYGVNLEFVNCVESDIRDVAAVAFVSRTEFNNGVSGYVKPVDGIEAQPKDTITVAGGGSVLSTFLQTRSFYSGRDLYLLYTKEELSIPVKLFLITLIKANKYRFNYGRQANTSLKTLNIRLPVNTDGTPDWKFMEYYIKSLPYGDRL